MIRIKVRTTLFAMALAGALTASGLAAQEAGTLPEAKAPVAVQTVQVVVPAAKMPRDEQIKVDWPWLGRFKEADLALAAPAAGEDRVVFMGDSITQGWKIEGPAGTFPGKPYINRGISGQTTPQMVLRFHQDVVNLKPKA